MDKRNYCLYRHRNKINGKVYIGITCRTTNHRWGRNGDGYKLQPIFYGAIKKYGWDNFEHDVLFNNLTELEAKFKEIAAIKFYHSYVKDKKCNGYNATLGGDCRDGWSTGRKLKSSSLRGANHPNYHKIFTDEELLRIKIRNSKFVTSQYSNEGQYINSYLKYQLYDTFGNTDSLNIIRHTNNGENYRYKGFIWKRQNKKHIDYNNILSDDCSTPYKGKAIYALNDNFQIIGKYDSILEASEQFHISTGEICACCKHTRKKTHGYIFCYQYDIDTVINDYSLITNNHHRKIYQIDENGNIIETFDKITDAAQKYNITPQSISRVLRHKRKTVKNMRFIYA